eukprot:GHVQ01007197.1.p1 GENE.GHVQ01007197.1~~GHVQ01007197.1.p1  ORF type:complete len:475 (-),score=52.77 GHVQ01007197.1:2443-3867(-)
MCYGLCQGCVRMDLASLVQVVLLRVLIVSVLMGCLHCCVYVLYFVGWLWLYIVLCFVDCVSRSLLSGTMLKEVVIVGVARTPIGSFLGNLSSFQAHELGAVAIKGALKRSRVQGSEVDQVVVGQVLTAGAGQAPHRQASLLAGIPSGVDVYGVNKVCSSGLKSVCLASQSIALGQCDIAVAVGMESMSNCPYYLTKARHGGYKHGHGSLIDGLLRDGLWDPYNDIHMGKCTEKTAKDLGISRASQDEYAIESYRRATEAWKSGVIKHEVVPVHKPSGKSGRAEGPPYTVIDEDEEYSKLRLDKVAGLSPAFDRTGGTITAANASKLSDGASAIVLASADKARELSLTPFARILSMADAAVEPIDFAVAPARAIVSSLDQARVPKSSVDLYEINEAFSAVVIANAQTLGLSHEKINVHGGAVALGHPLGMSGNRILISLLTAMHSRGGTIGCAAICNGGGGATALVVDRYIDSKL